MTNNIIYCDDCGESINEHCYDIVTLDGDMVVCEDCFCSKSPHKCIACDNYVSFDYVTYFLEEARTCICDECGEHYFRCTACDNIYPDELFNTYNGDIYCDNCYENVSITYYLHNYSYKPNYKYYSMPYEANSNLTIGIELEIDDGDNQSNVVKDIGSEFGDLVYCKEDGSLSYLGIELVTMPMTYEYIKDNRIINRMCDIAYDNGYYSYDTDTCGLHMHFDKSFFGGARIIQEHTACKILYYMWLNQDTILRFSKREEHSFDEWCNFVNCEDMNGLQEEDTDYNSTLSYIFDKCCESRYRCLNVRNKRTYEFRIFKGTLNANSILEYLRWCINLIDICRYGTLEDIRILDNKTILNKEVTIKCV